MPLAIELTVPVLFVAGATTSLHCALMCGAINAAQVRSQGPVPLPQTLALVHGGRVLGYALLGALAGALGGRLALWLPETFAGQGLQALASLALVAAGLQQLRTHRHRARHLAGCAGRNALALPGPVRARLLGQGLLWALMPCGILYTVLLLAALTTRPLTGFVLLAAFGLGTVPLMGVSGGLFGLATRPQDTRVLRLIAAGALIVLGLAGTAAALLQPDWLRHVLCAPGA
jgi:uncharacterized protein